AIHARRSTLFSSHSSGTSVKRISFVSMLALSLGALVAAPADAQPSAANAASAAPAVATVPGMPPVVDPANLYSEASAGHLTAVARDALPRVYVPNVGSMD